MHIDDDIGINGHTTLICAAPGVINDGGFGNG